MFTPFPTGEMPAGVNKHSDGPPYGRVLLDPEPTASRTLEGLEIIRDKTSGEFFAIRRNVPCGAGCRCAAEATWLPRHQEG